MEETDKCVFCELTLTSGETHQLRKKGLEKILKVCSRLKIDKQVKVGQLVHKVCRKLFVDEKNVSRLERRMKDNLKDN